MPMRVASTQKEYLDEDENAIMNHPISALTSLSACNDGTGCEEAYQFKRQVDTLPSLMLGL